MSYLLHAAAALAGIAGCFSFRAWRRPDKPALWLLPGALSLLAFAWLLALTPAGTTGRALAAYGGIVLFAARGA